MDPGRTPLWAALDWLARFHAHHWGDPSGEWRRSVWDRGGFWTNRKGVVGLSARWRETCRWMNTRHGDSVPPGMGAVGTRLEALHGPLAAFLADQSRSARWSTLLHGDFKAANLFFSGDDRHNDDHNDGGGGGGDDSAATECCALDFQYVGPGVPAEDLAYLLFPDAHGDFWETEARCLEFYHDRLMEHLVVSNKGGPSSLPLESLVAHYELSRLEFLIDCLRKGWVGSTPGDARLVRAVDDTLQRIEDYRGKGSENEPADLRTALDRFVNNKHPNSR